MNNLNIDELNIDELNTNELNIDELNIIKNKIKEIGTKLIEQQKINTNNLKKIKQKICIKCIENFGEHIWIKEKENCMYGETYEYCSRCGKDKFTNTIYDI